MQISPFETMIGSIVLGILLCLVTVYFFFNTIKDLLNSFLLTMVLKAGIALISGYLAYLGFQYALLLLFQAQYLTH